MKARLFGVLLAGLVGVAVTGGEVACSSSSGGGGFSCTDPGHSECSTEPAGQGSMCAGGRIGVSSCPSSNQLGCCSATATASDGRIGIITTCYYCVGLNNPTAASLERDCTLTAQGGQNGTWTAGDTMQCGDGGAGRGGDAATD
jgi:hypothetical protein